MITTRHRKHPGCFGAAGVLTRQLGRHFLLLALFATTSLLHAAPADKPQPPNIVMIYADDLGYGDLGCYGHPVIRTPHLDRMAATGMRFTEFYSTAEVCTPSRTALMTGRYPIRSGMCHNQFRVLRTKSLGRLPDSEVTVAELLKDRGYRTGFVGKWHLGVWSLNPAGHPSRHGFDHVFGVEHSNDMDPTPARPKAASGRLDQDAAWWNTRLYRGTELVERPADQTQLTAKYAAEAVQFIQKASDQPFFLYYAHTFPHVPLFASERFRGKSAAGLFGDVVEELDWSVGEVLGALKAKGIEDNTLVVFSSDNGPWLIMNQAGGSAGPLKDGKGSTWEGGMRVPGIARWPGRIPAGVVQREMATTMDLFVTFAKLGGAEPPSDRPIDGVDIRPLLFEQKTVERNVFCYYRGATLYAARLGPWKAHFITQAAYGAEKPVAHETPQLYHVRHDPGEKHNVAADHPEVVAQITAAVDRHCAGVQAAPSQLIELAQ
jgi:arylsulfatase A